jgi:hypothetical protein
MEGQRIVQGVHELQGWKIHEGCLPDIGRHCLRYLHRH